MFHNHKSNEPENGSFTFYRASDKYAHMHQLARAFDARIHEVLA